MKMWREKGKKAKGANGKTSGGFVLAKSSQNLFI